MSVETKPLVRVGDRIHRTLRTSPVEYPPGFPQIALCKTVFIPTVEDADNSDQPDCLGCVEAVVAINYALADSYQDEARAMVDRLDGAR